MTREFVCDDCKVTVFEFGGEREGTRCYGCEMIREMKATRGMSPKMEATLREIMNCQLPRDDDALRPADGGSG